MNEIKIDIGEFRQALGSFLTGVTVVTTVNDQNHPLGFTANSFTSVSLDPPLVLVCLAKASGLCDSFANSCSFAINILAENQQDISGIFASPIADRYAEIDWRKEATGSPIINNVAAWLDCNMHEVVDAGDHMIFIGEVIAFGNTNTSPLGYLRGNYVRFALEQEAAVAMENPDQKTSVGVIVERKGEILLLEDEEGLHLPHAPRLGNEQDEDSLLGKLKSLGLLTNAYYLFAVFENSKTNILSIIYRMLTEEISEINSGTFYAFNDIPLEKIPDELTQMMLKRYISERNRDAFGIYVGDQEKGAIEPLARNKL